MAFSPLLGRGAPGMSRGGSMSAPTGVSAPRGNITGYNLKNVPQFTPEQMNMLSTLLGGTQQGLGGGLDFLSKLASGSEEGFKEAEAPYHTAFQKQLGEIGTRFGGMGALGSSAFQNATSGAAQSLSENLGAQRLGLRQNAIQELLGLSQNLLGQRPYETFAEEKPDFMKMLGNLLGGLGGSATSSFGGKVGKGIGNKLLGLFGLG